MKKERLSTRHDKMEKLDEADIRSIYFHEKKPDQIYQDILHDIDIKDFDTLCAGMKEVAYKDPRAAKALNRISTPAYNFFLRPFGEFMAESNWFAERTRGDGLVSKAVMSVLQRMYTMSHLGCSTTVVWDEQAEEYLIMRSLDWDGAKSICGATRIYHHYAKKNDPDLVYRSVGTLGMIGDLTVQKPGLCAIINFAPWLHISVSMGTEPTFLLRKLFEDKKITTFDQAKSAILKWKTASPVFITLCGAEKKEACVIEIGYRGKKNIHPISGPYLIQTNHFFEDENSPFKEIDQRLDQSKQTNPKPLIDAIEHDDIEENWYCSDLMPNSKKRQSMIENELQNFQGSSKELEEKLIEIYSVPPVFNYETIYWAMMRPKSDQMTIFRRER